MADIKNMSIFSNTANGMEAIKKASNNKNEITPSPSIEKTNEIKRQMVVTKEKTKRTIKRTVGAPVKNLDRTHASKQPIKLSAILNSTSRSMVEKYETKLNKDELLRKALDAYIKQNLTKEDKIDLLRDVTRDLNIFREKNPTIEMIDEDGTVLKTAEEIELETENELRSRWGIEPR
ncbi:hypothetical protein KUA55_17650 [Enterococcus sp. ALS3]|uniref:Uncharacterized protein n=1 Tax=Enterococcus alishanensis TaxID=1303817 RepID=A0ABS6THT0_9ENTE|nr:hypothetical protein [Enterococcus alishanensis]MBV7392480.1 hypothetical protein [Enterococcus alishanensis]